jgi:hypothetical protein
MEVAPNAPLRELLEAIRVPPPVDPLPSTVAVVTAVTGAARSSTTHACSDLVGKFADEVFGESVALSFYGNRVAVGVVANLLKKGCNDAGLVRIYDWTGNPWTQVGPDLVGEAGEHDFGSKIALSSDGNRVAIGAPCMDDKSKPGHVRIYDWTGSQWTQVGSDLAGRAPGDLCGSSIALSSDGNRIAIGALCNDNCNGVNAGHVRIYDWTGSQWTQQGSDLVGEASNKLFGYSVALSSDGTRVAIGAKVKAVYPRRQAGHVRIYDWTGSQWAQVGSSLVGEAAGDWYGQSVALSSDGNRVAIGTSFSDATGHIRIYDWRAGSDWIRKGFGLVGKASSNRFGNTNTKWFGNRVSLSSDGSRIAIGTFYKNRMGVQACRVQIYDCTGSQWAHEGSDLSGGANDVWYRFNVTLSADGNRVAIGVPKNIRRGSKAGYVRIYDLDDDVLSSL